jgi:hypothetical protein
MHVKSNHYVAAVSLIIHVKQHQHIDSCWTTEADIWASGNDAGAEGMGYVIQETCGGIDSSNRTYMFILDWITGASSLQFEIKEWISGSQATISLALPCSCSNEIWIVLGCGANPMLVTSPLQSQKPDVTAELP